jgi:glutathione S-transferase
MPTLHQFHLSGNCYKVRLTARHASVPLTLREVDMMGGETRRPAFLKINPNGRVPTLVLDDGRILPESNAAMWWLARDSALNVMEAHLAKSERFAGRAFSIADIALYAHTHCAADGGFDLAGFPHVGARLARVAAQPGHMPMSAR